MATAAGHDPLVAGGSPNRGGQQHEHGPEPLCRRPASCAGRPRRNISSPPKEVSRRAASTTARSLGHLRGQGPRRRGSNGNSDGHTNSMSSVHFSPSVRTHQHMQSSPQEGGQRTPPELSTARRWPPPLSITLTSGELAGGQRGRLNGLFNGTKQLRRRVAWRARAPGPARCRTPRPTRRAPRPTAVPVNTGRHGHHRAVGHRVAEEHQHG